MNIIQKLQAIAFLVCLLFFVFIDFAISNSEINNFTDTNRKSDIIAENSIRDDAEFIPGEIIVKFKQGVEPGFVLKDCKINVLAIDRVSSIEPVVSMFKKKLSLQRDSDGWYWYLGKKYSALEDMSNEEIFESLFNEMPDDEKAIYQNYRIKLPEDMSVEKAITELKINSDVEYVHPNYILKTTAVPNDTFYGYQWGLKKIKFPEALDINNFREEIVIAVLDTGVDYNHEDLSENIWVNKGEVPNNGKDDDGNGYVDDYNGYDFVSIASNYVYSGEDYGPEDNDPIDVQGHGTHCAGIAAAVTNNQKGVSGVSVNSKIMPVRVCFADKFSRGVCSSYDFLRGMQYAIYNKARVINLSLGSYGAAGNDMMKFAYNSGAIIVAGAGNDNTSRMFYPAAFDNVIAVSSVDSRDFKAYSSNFGFWIDVAAPGEGIYSTFPESFKTKNGYFSNYGYDSGTSMAAPYVAGLAALIWSNNPQYTNSDIYKTIIAACDDIGFSGKDMYFGYGRINIYNALAYKVRINSPPEGSYVRGEVSVVGSASIVGSFDKYSLYLSPINDNGFENRINLNYSQVIDDWLGRFDTRNYPDGDYELVLKCFEKNGNSISFRRKIIIDNINNPPQFIDLGNKGAVIGKELKFKVKAADIDDPGTLAGRFYYSCNYDIPGARFDPVTKEFSWTPSIQDNGKSFSCVFEVRDNVNVTKKEIKIVPFYVEIKKVNPHIYNQELLDVSKDKVMYLESSDVNKAFLYDLMTSSEKQVINDKNSVRRAFIDQYSVICGLKCDNKIQVYSCDFLNNNSVKFITELLNTNDLFINNGRMFWAQKNYPNNEIYFLDLKSFRKNKITTIPYNALLWDQDMRIYEYKLVLEEIDTVTGDTDIFLYDIYNNNKERITNNSYLQFLPNIYKNKITWLDTRNYSNLLDYFDIYMWDSVLKREVKISGDILAAGYRPSLNEDAVVWVNKDYNGFGFYRFMDDLSMFIPIESGVSSSVRISGNTLFFVGYDRGEKVMLAKFIQAPKINSVSKNIVNSGENVFIHGENFGKNNELDANVVLSDGRKIKASIYKEDTVLSFVAPRYSYSGDIKVVTKAGISNAIKFQIRKLPEYPNNLKGVVYSPTQVRLTWKDNSDNETGFIIERMSMEEFARPILYPGDRTFKVIDRVSSGVTSTVEPAVNTMRAIPSYLYHFKGKIPAQFKFRVKAYNEYGESACSNEVFITMPSSIELK